MPCFATVAESEYNDSFATADELPSSYENQAVTGTISGENDVDFYSFIAANSGGDVISFTTDKQSAYLYDENQVLLDFYDNIIGNAEFQLIGEFTTGHKYYIKVCGYCNVINPNNYSFSITPKSYNYDEVEFNNSFETSNILPNFPTTDTFSASISEIPAENMDYDVDYYRFTPGASGNFTIETTSNIDTFGYLYDSNHNLLTSDDDYGEGTNFKFTYNLTGYQTYYLLIRPYDETYIGDYNIKITPPDTLYNDGYGNNFNTAEVIDLDYTTSSSQINYSGDIDFFKFTTGSSGGYVTFESSGFTDVIGELYDEVYDENNNIVHNLLVSDDDSGDGDNFRFEASLSANQTYYLKIYSPVGVTGSFSFDVLKGKILNVPNYSQQPYDNLCWATSAAMFISYANNDNDDRKVDAAKFKYSSTPADEYPSIFNQPGSISAVYDSIVHFLGMKDSTYYPKPSESITFNELKDIIDDSHPLPTMIGWATGGAHAHIIKGYYELFGEPYVIYNDPWDGIEYSTTFDSYMYNSTYNYLNSVQIIDQPLLTQENEPNDMFSSAQNCALALSLDFDANISIHDVDYYCFTPADSDSYTIESKGSTDTVGYLYDSQNTPSLDSDDNDGIDNNFSITYNLTANQKYYIKVQHKNDGEYGDYKLRITQN